MDRFLEFVQPIKNIIGNFFNKKIVLYGYGYSGIYLEYILEEFFNLKVDYIVDKNITIYGKPINRPNLFEYLSDSEIVVLLTMSKAETIEKELSQIGNYKKNVNIFNMKEIIYGADKNVCINFFFFLEYRFRLDLLKEEDTSELDYDNADAFRCSPSRQMSMSKIFNNLLIEPKDKIIDIGCGKGGAILLIKNCGFNKVDGIELSKVLCNIARENLDKLQIENTNIINMDASLFDEYENYNFFYFYNPFQGNTFKGVIEKIENSYKKKKRSIHIIYANPTCHKSVIENGIFQLVQQVPTDYDCRLVNIYNNLEV